MEPAVSLEFLRHLTVDAIRSNLALHERLVKIAKFVNRSSADHQATDIIGAEGLEDILWRGSISTGPKWSLSVRVWCRCLQTRRLGFYTQVEANSLEEILSM